MDAWLLGGLGAFNVAFLWHEMHRRRRRARSSLPSAAAAKKRDSERESERMREGGKVKSRSLTRARHHAREAPTRAECANAVQEV